MNILDSRVLITLREELKQSILDRYNESEEGVECYEDIPENYIYEDGEEFKHIKEIDALERECGDEFEYGLTFIEEDDFTDYCEELCQDLGYISKDFPRWIEIDWGATAQNIKTDYSKMDYQGKTYYFRA